MNASEWRLGIDFGTSNTVAILMRPDGRRDPLLFDGSPLLSSSVFADAAGDLLVGRDAWLHAESRPDSIEPHPKLRIDDDMVMLGDREVTVTDLIAAVLTRVAAEASRTAATAVSSTVLTYPATWGARRRARLVDAASRAGLPRPALVAEPVAAAACYLSTTEVQIPVGACAVVFDFGAGTFDVSLVRRTTDGWTVLAAEGLADAGGLDVDAAIVTHLGGLLATRDPTLWRRLAEPASLADRRSRRQLWDNVRTAKEALSRSSSAPIHVPVFDDTVPLGREVLERLARPVLDRTVQATAQAVQAAGVASTQLAAVYLVG